LAIAAISDCLPNCAAGHFHSYPVLVVLWGRAALRAHPGTLRYTKITLIYTGSRAEGPGRLPGHGHRGPVGLTVPSA
jgi:hypothetical protein